jgi:hypothetical protein
MRSGAVKTWLEDMICDRPASSHVQMRCSQIINKLRFQGGIIVESKMRINTSAFRDECSLCSSIYIHRSLEADAGLQSGAVVLGSHLSL